MLILDKDFDMKKQTLLPKTQIFDYLQTDKIEQLYNQIVELRAVTLTKEQGSEQNKSVEGEGGLGDVLGMMGLKMSAKGSLGTKKEKSESIVYELSPEQKLQRLLDHLLQENLAANFNQCIREKRDLSQFVLLKFECTNCKSKILHPPPELEKLPYQISISCESEEYQAEFLCSVDYFHASSLLTDIATQIPRKINVIGALKTIDYEKKKIYINPIAF